MDYQIGEGFIRVLDRRYNKSQIKMLQVQDGTLVATDMDGNTIVPYAPYNEVEDPGGDTFPSSQAMDDAVVAFFIDAPDSGGGGAIGDGNAFYVEDGNGNVGAKSDYSKGMVTDPLEFIWGNPTEDNRYTAIRLDNGSITLQDQEQDMTDPESPISITGRSLTIDSNRVQISVFENDETGAPIASFDAYFRSDGLELSGSANGNTGSLSAGQYGAGAGVTTADYGTAVGIDVIGDTGVAQMRRSDNATGAIVQYIRVGEDDKMEIRDDFLGMGLVYAGDYSGSWTDRSLVDKAYVDSVAGGGGGGATPDLQAVTTEGSTTSTTITHAAADSTSKSATLGQANTVARAPFIVAEVESIICPADYALRWPGTADSSVNISPTLSSSSYGKSIFFFNTSATFSATLSPTDAAGGGRMWIDDVEEASIVVPPLKWIRFFHDGVIWVCIGKSF